MPMNASFSPVDRDLGIATVQSLRDPNLIAMFQSRRPGFGDCDSNHLQDYLKQLGFQSRRPGFGDCD